MRVPIATCSMNHDVQPTNVSRVGRHDFLTSTVVVQPESCNCQKDRQYCIASSGMVEYISFVLNSLRCLVITSNLGEHDNPPAT